MNIPLTETLENENLLLRSASLADIPFIFSATRHTGFNEGMQWEPPTYLHEFIGPYERSLQKWKDGTAYGFSIIKKEGDCFLGKTSIRKTEVAHIWDVGFWIHPVHQGKGYMSESLGLLMAFGFDRLEAQAITAAHALWNKASEKVLQKHGFVFKEYLEKGFQKRGAWVSENLLELSRKDWEMKS